MKTLKKLIIPIFCIIILSCNNKDKAKYYYVPEETIPVYQLNDTLIYQDEGENKNIFIVSDIHDGFYKKNENEENYLQQYILYFTKSNNNCDSCMYEIICDVNSTQRIFWETSLYALNLTSPSPVLNEFKVFSETYEDVNIFNSFSLNTVPDSIYYHYKYGVLQFKDINGLIWKLYKKPNH